MDAAYLVNYSAKIISITALLLIAFSISPTGEHRDPSDRWVTTQVKWIKNFDSKYATAVTINPIMLYIGLLCGIISILLG